MSGAHGKASDMRIALRPASPHDGPALREIERLAGERFRDVGLPEIADHDPPPVEVLARYAAAGRSWIALADAGHPIGYVLVDAVDGNAHIEQVSVRPDHQGVGAGRALIDRVCAWAIERGMPAVTLTTFTDVPWNAPLYRHLGFRVLAEDEIGPELLAVRDAETTHGLDPATRVCMRLELAV
jgi:GNAT superfamily N-acetyltransferase